MLAKFAVVLSVTSLGLLGAAARGLKVPVGSLMEEGLREAGKCPYTERVAYGLTLKGKSSIGVIVWFDESLQVVKGQPLESLTLS